MRHETELHIDEASMVGLSSAESAKLERLVMVPYLKNRADMVDGHYCIARKNTNGYHEYWNDKLKKWCSAGTVFELNEKL